MSMWHVARKPGEAYSEFEKFICKLIEMVWVIHDAISNRIELRWGEKMVP